MHSLQLTTFPLTSGMLYQPS